MYRNWPRYIGKIEVCPVQLPGRENRLREKLYETYEALASDLADALAPYMDRPFAFFGHCGSALPCYEVTKQLMQRGGRMPIRLFVSSQVAPHQGPYGRFLHMTDEELTDEMSGLIRQLGGEPIPDLVALSLRVLRADVDANKRYRLQDAVRLSCPITAIGWSGDIEVDPTLMAGWSDCGETSFRLLEGVHYRFLQAPAELLTLLATEMSSVVQDERQKLAEPSTTV